MVAAVGTSWRSMSSRLAPRSPDTKLTPVTLPPGRLRSGDQPVHDRIAAGREYDRHGRGGSLGRERRIDVRDNDLHGQPDQFSDQARQALELIVGVAVFDRDVLAFVEPSRCQTLAEAPIMGAETASDVLRKNPITGTRRCCARAASGHAAAPPRA